MENQQIAFLVIGLILLSVFMFLPQWQARRRRQKQMNALHTGDKVMTIGGIIGKLTFLNTEEERARIEIAPGVEMDIVLTAISRTLTPSSSPEPAPESTEE